MKKFSAIVFTTMLLASTNVLAKDIKIESNTSGLDEAKAQTIAKTATSMGVKEPVSLQKQGNNVVVSGASATTCTVKVSANGTIAGVSCK